MSAPWPGHRFDQALVEHYAKKLADALVAATKGIGDTVRRAMVHKAAEPHDLTIAKGAIASGVTIDREQLVDVLRSLYGDAYLGGAHGAGVALGPGAVQLTGGLGDLDATIDWDSWEPGYGEAAVKVATGGLRDKLNGAAQIIRGVSEDALDHLGNALAEGIASGDGMDAIARSLQASFSQMASSQALTIARTETASAMGSAAMDVYEANGVEQLDLLVTDPCEECQEIEDQNPWDRGDAEPLPIHPNCRCAWAPAGG